MQNLDDKYWKVPDSAMSAGPGDNGAVDTALELLEQVTSIRVVGEFLKSRSLSFSAGSWAELRDKRIKTFLKQGNLRPIELFQLLGEAEEYGRSHIFLYRCKRETANRLLEEGSIVATARSSRLDDRLNTPIVLDQPEVPTISEIRYGGTGASRFLVVKVIERRQHKKYLGENQQGDLVTREWKIEKTRAVNVVRLSPSGLLEIRLQSHVNGSQYQDDITRIWSKAASFIPIKQFQVFSLSKAKQQLWENRTELKSKLRFSDSQLRNDAGSTVTAATGDWQADLFEDEGAKNSVDAFLKSGAYCDASNVWWIKQEDGVPGADLHMNLSGMDNEFAIPSNCNKEEYEYVLDQLKKACS